MTHTKGNIIVENIKVGDIHYEFEYGCGIEVEVLTTPTKDGESGLWEWVSKSVKTGKIVNYAVHEDYAHYGPNLYDYKAYTVNVWI